MSRRRRGKRGLDELSRDGDGVAAHEIERRVGAFGDQRAHAVGEPLAVRHGLVAELAPEVPAL
jgi:hypothetical protein